MEPLVFLPGMMCDARIFGPQIKQFGKTRAIHLAPISRFDTVEQLARDVLANAPERFALAGLSMGGIVAMEVIRQAPERVSRIALMDTNALGETPQVAAAREPQIVKVMSGLLPEVVRDEMKPQYLASGPGRDAILDLVLEMALDLGEGVFVRQSRALQKRPDQQATLRRILVPTLILCGAEDTLCPIERHEFMAEMVPQAELRIIANAGHLPTLEQPEAVILDMEAWLRA